jgi:hypothetical protein
VSIRKDFHPLCNEHYSEMVGAEATIRVSASEVRIPVQACSRLGCSRLYDFESGYYDSTTHGRLQGKYDSPYTCDEHLKKLFLRSYDHRTNTEVWQCPTEGCTRNEMVRTAA